MIAKQKKLMLSQIFTNRGHSREKAKWSIIIIRISILIDTAITATVEMLKEEEWTSKATPRLCKSNMVSKDRIRHINRPRSKRVPGTRNITRNIFNRMLRKQPEEVAGKEWAHHLLKILMRWLSKVETLNKIIILCLMSSSNHHLWIKRCSKVTTLTKVATRKMINMDLALEDQWPKINLRFQSHPKDQPLVAKGFRMRHLWLKDFKI